MHVYECVREILCFVQVCVREREIVFCAHVCDIDLLVLQDFSSSKGMGWEREGGGIF